MEKHDLAPGSKRFLDNFGEYERSGINTRFLAAIRNGAMAPDAVITSVIDTLQDEMRNLLRRKQVEYCAKNREVQKALRAHPEDALALAEHGLWWESQSDEERKRIKEEKDARYRDAYMNAQPPTEKQVAFLRSKGYEEEVTSKLEASRLIQDLIATN